MPTTTADLISAARRRLPDCPPLYLFASRLATSRRVLWVHDRSCGRMEATAADGAASGATVMECLSAAVLAEVGRADRQDALGTATPQSLSRVGGCAEWLRATWTTTPSLATWPPWRRSEHRWYTTGSSPCGDGVSGTACRGNDSPRLPIAGYPNPTSCTRVPTSDSSPSTEVRAVCGNAARTDLRGGPPERAVPTATDPPECQGIFMANLHRIAGNPQGWGRPEGYNRCKRPANPIL